MNLINNSIDKSTTMKMFKGKKNKMVIPLRESRGAICEKDEI